MPIQSAYFDNTPETDDPPFGQFLTFLARDISNHPEHLQTVDASWFQRIQSLVAAVDIALDNALLADDD